MKPTSIIIVMSQDQNDAQTACWTFSQGSGWQAPTLAHQSATITLSPTLRHSRKSRLLGELPSCWQ